MNCPMTALECISCDDATGCKLLSARALCVAPDCSCEMECRAEPWAKHGLCISLTVVSTGASAITKTTKS